MDNRLFVSTPFLPLLPSCATTTLTQARFLIDSGATHDVVSEKFAAQAGLRLTPARTTKTISGFDGSLSKSSFELTLLLDTETKPLTFMVARLKDTYNGILGMPWIRRHGNRTDWRTRCFRPFSREIATADAVSSVPGKNLAGREEPVVRHARKTDKGKV
ncbi:hypothetical protein PTTG_27671 [Puccinia triticina 1-1 BBBD Race 1]|uniref:Peptidase A2 domain-containing protein n=1 Tax=Puccinia triticina (isolate 1-1 / race 1 (BBBD)) TaxID=630390 RepID=A0A180GIF5_PUCT1|nr:hypothetical protein PTTG_27671 [Puccinia triticina 1-1 BBBD Race 1]